MHEDENMLLQSIYEEYQQPLRRLAKSMNVPDVELDDVVQETFIAYFKNYSLTWSPVRKKAMLVKILKSKAIDCLRRNSHFEKVELTEAETVKTTTLTDAVMSDPLDIMISEEGLLIIAGEISNMRMEWREIALLYFIEQKTISEICEILDIPGAVCRSRIYRTRVYLKKALKAKKKD
jgi:RNA polymerase sigma-70 factor (ECF subfamily)